MSRVNLDLKKLLGFKIIASQLGSIKSLKISIKISCLKRKL
jgi:hypothetical protein